MQLRGKGFFFAFILVLLVGCSPGYLKYKSSYHINLSSPEPDYSNLYYWAAHPWKKDPSDSVPKPLRRQYMLDSTVDVFFLHPTTLTDYADTNWNAQISDTAINLKTDYTTILFQASAFNHYRVFAPRYRQAHIRSYFTKDSTHANAAFELAYADLKNAFQYYMDHYNQGRPIIIASHSQGSTHAQRLLKEFFDSRPLQKQLVAAYVIGMYIPPTAFTNIKICTDSTQTGCVCGWRTFKMDYEPDFVKEEKGTCAIINPLTWNQAPGLADRSGNTGAVLTNFNKVYTHLTSAEIHDGILWVGKLHFPGGFLIRRKNFHIGDINLFYLNIQEDLKRRVSLFRVK